MGKEEQQEEREVLDSIFPDEITDVSETEYRISITLDVTSVPGDDGDEPEAEPPTILLSVQYPPTYPDVPPRLDISTPPNASNQHPHLDIQTDKPQLLASLDPTIEESLGMAMVFSLVSALKEAAENLIAERVGAVAAAREVEAAKAEEEENRKFHGEAVTRESFLKWREGFLAEREEEERRRAEEAAAEEKKRRGGGGGGGAVGGREEGKLTGRQLWERGLAGRVEDEEDGGVEGGAVAEGVAKLSVVE